MAITNAFPDLKRDLSFHTVKNDQPQKLTPEELEHFNDKGYITGLDVFDDHEIAEHRAYFDRIMALAEEKGFDSFSIVGWESRLPELYDICLNAKILDYVEDLIGPNIICWVTHYFCKMPSQGNQVSWHQDASNWPLTPSKTVTAWLAIDDTDVENGAMQFIPGSHVHGQIAFERSTLDEKNVLFQTVKAAEQYGDAPVYIELKAGQMSVHTDLLLHGSDPNMSARRRCGLTFRFTSPDVRRLDDSPKLAILCRGNDSSGFWKPMLRPDVEVVPDYHHPSGRGDLAENH